MLLLIICGSRCSSLVGVACALLNEGKVGPGQRHNYVI